MTTPEQEKAAYYKAHKDDPEVWSDEAEPTKEQSPLGASITVRIAPQDAQLLREVAKRTGIRYSEIVRQAVAQFVRPQFSFDYAFVRQVFGQVSPPEAPKVWTFGPAQHTETAASNIAPRRSAVPASDLWT